MGLSVIRSAVCAVALSVVLSALAVEFAADGATLRLSDTCGAVESLVVDGGGRGATANKNNRIVPAAEAFALQLLDGKGEPTRLKSSEFVFETVGTRVPRVCGHAGRVTLHGAMQMASSSACP